MLPSGRTLTGVYSVTGVATESNQYFDSPIASGFRFASVPVVVTVGIDDTPAEAAAAGRPGTASDPKAASGKVCLYETSHENLNTLLGVVETDGDPVKVSGSAPPGSDFGVATRFGTIVEITSVAARYLNSNGTWAATSP